jgi:transcriptional regulator GlxA family with amidase domain
MPSSIVVLVADGFADSGLSIALDVFRTANAISKRRGRSSPFGLKVASAHGGRVQSASGLSFAQTQSVAVASRAHAVITPGIWVESASEMDAVLQRCDVTPLVKALARAHERGALVGSSCGGAFVLAEAGLLDFRTCTTTWWLAPALQERRLSARVDASQALVVHDRVLTAGAVFAQADLALHLVARFAGPAVAEQCVRLLLLDRHPSQAPYMAVRTLAANDETVRGAESWVRKHLAEPFDIAELARHLGVSPRTLARRLKSAVGASPIGFIQRIRVEAAVTLLETSRLSLQEISDRVGYSDSSALRRLIRREVNASPRDLRSRR